MEWQSSNKMECLREVQRVHLLADARPVHGDDAQQANDLLGRIMELSTAATSAANTANTMREAFTQGGRVSNHGLEKVQKC